MEVKREVGLKNIAAVKNFVQNFPTISLVCYPIKGLNSHWILCLKLNQIQKHHMECHALN